jgi:hypothetical protein
VKEDRAARPVLVRPVGRIPLLAAAFSAEAVAAVVIGHEGRHEYSDRAGEHGDHQSKRAHLCEHERYEKRSGQGGDDPVGGNCRPPVLKH